MTHTYALRQPSQPRRTDASLCCIHDALPPDILHAIYLLALCAPPRYLTRSRVRRP
eukprot:COSAG06_NODE_4393_length_4303_cov_2.859420_2_plen_56_part_00